MENRQDGIDQLFENEQLTLREGSLLAGTRREAIPVLRKRKRSHIWRKGERKLYVALALLIVAVCISIGLLVVRVRAETEATKEWSYQAGYGLYYSPVIASGVVYGLYLGNPGEDFILYAMDARSGLEKWFYPIYGLIGSPPIVADGMVYLLADDPLVGGNTLHVLDAITGSEKWSYQEKSISPPLIANGIVYINSQNGTLEALDARSGHKLWSRPTPVFSSYTPVLSYGSMYALDDSSGEETTLYALDAATGREKWSFQQVWPTILVSQPVTVDGMVLVGSNDGSLYALNALTGREQWAYQQWYAMGSFNYFMPTVVDDTVYVNAGSFDGSSYTGHLYALDARSGSRIWADLDQMIPETPEVVNGSVYVHSTDGNLYALDTRTGDKHWSYPVGISIDTPEPAVFDDAVYVTAKDGNLHVLNEASGREEWSYGIDGFSWLAPSVANGIVYVADGDKLDAIQPPAVIP